MCTRLRQALFLHKNIFRWEDTVLANASFRHLKTMLQLHEEGKIGPIKPIHSFHITDISSAIRTFSQRNQSGKIVLKYGATGTPKMVKVERPGRRKKP
jgi:D-arabinose 1-dehydrogenase-like Zn-dependent alcohol dehydrogenase